MSCGVGCRRGSDLASLWLWLWLWLWPVATAPTGPLAGEPPYAAGVALKSQEKKKKLFTLILCSTNHQRILPQAVTL